jgi:hypothetical protein
VEQKLTARDAAHLRYLAHLAAQTPGNWREFYQTPNEGMNFGLRFQLAFSGYALYALARRTPAYRAPYAAALHGLIEKMLHPDVWAYWFRGAVRRLPVIEAKKEPVKPSVVQKSVELAHNKLGLSGEVSPDPCAQGNIQYSAHLASLLAFYELLTNDKRYDREGFVLQAEARGETFEFPYTHTTLTQTIHRQMSENHFGGACCEPGRAYAACNNHAAINNVLYDRLHGTNLADVNTRWADWVSKKMLTGGISGKIPLPAPNGLLSTAYMSDLRLPAPVSFNLTDAWGLAFMASWQPDFVRQVYPRFRRRLKSAADDTLYLGSVGANESVEISSTELNTAFAAVLTREMGDSDANVRLLEWADLHLSPTETQTGRFYTEARPAPYVTALFAMCEALPAEGNGLHSLLSWRPDFSQPHLAQISPVAHVTAAYITENRLHVEFNAPPGESIELQIANCSPEAIARLNNQELSPQTVNRYNFVTDTSRNSFVLIWE